MGGFFGVVSKNDCVLDLFFGTDYHSHLGTKRAGMAVLGDSGYNRSIHSIQNAPFRTKFENDIEAAKGNSGIGCISDHDPQPLLVRSRLGNYAIATVGRINNTTELVENSFKVGMNHFLEMSGNEINSTELAASLIDQKDSFVEGLKYAQKMISGSMSIILLTHDGIYAARDHSGRTPVSIGCKKDAYCVSFESFAYRNLGYNEYKELGSAEIVLLTPEKCETKSSPRKEMKACSFMWVYYGYPPSSYEGVNVEEMRCRSGKCLALRDMEDEKPDIVTGVPDSGTAHAIGYSNASGIPFSRPYIKYTPTWPRSFMPHNQKQRDLIAKMKLLQIDSIYKGKKLLIIDDSIVRGTQAKETITTLHQSGAEEIHVRIACPPILYPCQYLNFSRSASEMDLIARKVIAEIEGEVRPENIKEYTDPDSEKHNEMVNAICKKLKFTSLKYQRIYDMINSIGIDPCKLCTYCWDGKK